MRNIPAGADLVAEDVAQAHADVGQTKDRHPGRHLALAPRLDVLRLLHRQGQEAVQLADRFHRQGVGHRLRIHRPQRLDGVIEGFDTGRGPELGRRGYCDLRIKDHNLGHDARVRRADRFDPGLLVRGSGKLGELPGREGGGNGDLGKRVLRPVA